MTEMAAIADAQCVLFPTAVNDNFHADRAGGHLRLKAASR